MTDRIWTRPATAGVRFDPPPADQPGWVEWAPVDARTCPLGDDCDLTVAWMAGQSEAKASLSDRITELKTQAGFARIDADQQRARAEAAEAEIARLKQRILDDTEEIRDMTQDHMDTIKAQLEIERQLSARAEAAEAGLARLRDAIVYATTELAQSAQDMPAMRAERRLIAAIRALPRQHPAPGNQGGKGGDDE
jgi:hypothetical protein